jgi:glutathione synthase/RimK-type ligase-like ATP-grasp enzyme
MQTIGILFGLENSFPGALAERINARNLDGIRAEFAVTGASQIDKAPPYAVIIDRISHEIPFYRSYLKRAVLSGTAVVNNPFWSSTDDKFFNYALAARLGVAVPPTVMLPHKQPPHGLTERSMRNLEFPLDWESVFTYVGEHGFLKPVDGRGWADVYPIHSREEFFRAYDQSHELCMLYQKAVDFSDYFRCCVVGQKKVRIMPYDPRRPHAERYVQGEAPHGKASKKLLKRMEQDAVKLCRALGYDINTVEFAVENGIPYAIDFMNPVPDADPRSVGEANFEWFVEQTAEMAIRLARKAPRHTELRWTSFLGANEMPAKARKKRPKRAKTSATKRKIAPQETASETIPTRETQL